MAPTACKERVVVLEILDDGLPHADRLGHRDKLARVRRPVHIGFVHLLDVLLERVELGLQGLLLRGELLVGGFGLLDLLLQVVDLLLEVAMPLLQPRPTGNQGKSRKTLIPGLSYSPPRTTTTRGLEPHECQSLWVAALLAFAMVRAAPALRPGRV